MPASAVQGGLESPLGVGEAFRDLDNALEEVFAGLVEFNRDATFGCAEQQFRFYYRTELYLVG